MIRDELDDFDHYWSAALLESDEKTKKIPGESDYSDLQAWAKGNSISIDQSTISVGRSLMTLLIDNLRGALWKMDSPTGLSLDIEGRKAGVSISEIEEVVGFQSMRGRKFRNDLNPDWARVEAILQALYSRRHIHLYQNENTLIGKSDESYIKEQITRIIQPIEPGDYPISRFLKMKEDDGAHFRLNHEDHNWGTYIRDRYGYPPNTTGILAGNLYIELPNNIDTYISFDLHLAFGETMSRKVSQFTGKERGLGQLEARIKICDLAANNDGFITLDQYYRIFLRNNAEHMADYYLYRSISDITSAKFRLHEVADSNPKKWNVEVDPILLRWRENSRQRGRDRNDNSESTEEGGTA
jgi:hypothetical protein